MKHLLAAAFLACTAPCGFAEPPDYVAPARDPARPAIGEWIGLVSWNSPIVAYAWRIDPDGAFSSGRVGRGESGGGAWGTDGAHLTLKYANGFRYEGELHGDVYSGAAYRADGRAFGGFSMRRARPNDRAPDDRAPDEAPDEAP